MIKISLIQKKMNDRTYKKHGFSLKKSEKHFYGLKKTASLFQ